MKADEARDAGKAASAGLRTGTGLIRDIHGGISHGVYAVVDALAGPAARPIRVVQDTITEGVYAVTGRGLDVGSRLVGAAVAARKARSGADHASLHDGPAAHHVIAIGSGLIDDSLVGQVPSLRPTMHVRERGTRVELTREGVGAAYPEATDEIVVFLHGLVETEAAWRLSAKTRPPYADRLRADLGLTPVMVRYNTGLRVSENGRLFAGLLADLVEAWPVPVRRIALIGHSMGGLIIHSAFAQAEDDPATQWRGLVTDTITLGTPHHGSPLARGAFAATAWLGRSRHTRTAAQVMRARSGSVRDLAHGNILAADWESLDVEELVDGRTHPAPAMGILHRAVGAAWGKAHPDGGHDRLSDFLVPVTSATHAHLAGEARRFTEDDIAVVHGTHHLGLLNSEETYQHLLRWLTPAIS